MHNAPQAALGIKIFVLIIMDDDIDATTPPDLEDLDIEDDEEDDDGEEGSGLH